MELLLYQNDSNSLRIFLDENGNYTLEVYPHDEHDSLPLPSACVKNFPMSEDKIPLFIEKIRKFNPLLLQIVEKESDLIEALREMKYGKGNFSDKFIN